MNKDIVKGNWQQLKGHLKEKWGNLTDNDITRLNGTREELEGVIREKYGYQQDRVQKEIDEFLKKNGYH